MRFALRETSWGWIGALAVSQGLQKIVLPLPSREQVMVDLGHEHGEEDAALVPFLDRIGRYLDGERVPLDDPWDGSVGTAFQNAVWRAAQEIPWGETRSYSQVAETIGRPGASRAVGRALGANPLPILIPCHRVLAADG